MELADNSSLLFMEVPHHLPYTSQEFVVRMGMTTHAEAGFAAAEETAAGGFADVTT